MAEEWKCQFCGSTQLTYPRQTVVLNKQGEYEPEVDYCCKSQKQNRRFIKRFPEDQRPDPDEVGEWN